MSKARAKAGDLDFELSYKTDLVAEVRRQRSDCDYVRETAATLCIFEYVAKEVMAPCLK